MRRVVDGGEDKGDQYKLHSLPILPRQSLSGTLSIVRRGKRTSYFTKEKTPIMKNELHLVLAAASSLAFAAIATSAAAQQISEQAVIDAQNAWGAGIVAIARTHADGGDYAARATEHINDLYAYGETNVMFKPTMAAEDQFRETFEEALSYFIGQDGTEDKGFAISGWTNVRWENNGIYTNDASAMAMGNYYFTGPDGNETKVEYTFGYVLVGGDLKINLHHSSLPYSPE